MLMQCTHNLPILILLSSVLTRQGYNTEPCLDWQSCSRFITSFRDKHKSSTHHQLQSANKRVHWKKTVGLGAKINLYIFFSSSNKDNIYAFQNTAAYMLVWQSFFTWWLFSLPNDPGLPHGEPGVNQKKAIAGTTQVVLILFEGKIFVFRSVARFSISHFCPSVCPSVCR